MFILRTISKDMVSLNKELGDEYEVISRFESYDLFKDIFKDVFYQDHVADGDPGANKSTKSCIGFLQARTSTFPLYDDEKYYVMTENGRTFENLSYHQ